MQTPWGCCITGPKRMCASERQDEVSCRLLVLEWADVVQLALFYHLSIKI